MGSVVNYLHRYWREVMAESPVLQAYFYFLFVLGCANHNHEGGTYK